MRTEYQFQLDAADYIAALRFNGRRLLQQSRSRLIDCLLIALTLSLLAAMLYFGDPGRLTLSPGFALCVVLLVWMTPFIIQIKTQLMYAYLARGDQWPMHCTLRLEEEGLRIVSPRGDTVLYWSAIRSVETPKQQLLIYFDRATFFQIPDTAFVSPAERVEFIEHIRARIVNPEVADADPSMDEFESPASVAPADSGVSPGQALLDNLRQGLRLLFLFRPEVQRLHFSWGQLIALTLLGVILPSLFEFARVGTDGYFSSYSLPGALFIVPLLIAAAWAFSLLDKQSEQTPALLIALFSMAVPYVVFDYLLRDVVDISEIGLSGWWGQWLDWFSYYAATLWLTLAAMVAAIRLLALPRRLWMGALAVSSVLLFLPLALVYRNVLLWMEPYDADSRTGASRSYYALANEDSFYRQPVLLEQELAKLRRGKPGSVELYFVGMAGYAPQDVFMKEVNSVEQLFEEKFGTAGRSVKLINNVATVDKLPVASATGLQKSLQRVAAVMNRDEDILFLFMTSHGSRDHKFSLNFGAMRFNDIDPSVLRKLLDESGIKRRVIVVSACYSGGFVEALKDDNSLVITASAPDKNSFGCSNENDFTHFGQAYFNEALRETYSFSEAFERAKLSVARREKEEGLDPPSDPRMALGKDIAPVLEAFAKKQGRTASQAAPGK